MTKLDKYWKKEKRTECPMCHRRTLWYDTHEDKNLTHYCSHCNDGIVIMGCGVIRNLDSSNDSVYPTLEKRNEKIKKLIKENGELERDLAKVNRTIEKKLQRVEVLTRRIYNDIN